MQTQLDASRLIAGRVRNLAPSPTLTISDRARTLKAQGIDVVDLGGGDPDFITPEHIRLAATEAMNAGETHYVASNGTPAFRKAIAGKLRNDNSLEYEPDNILVTPGGKASLFQAMQALVEPGVDVLIFEPAWVSYVPMIELAGGRPVPVALDPDNGYKITPDILQASVTDQTRAVLLNSPNNPSGRVATREELQAVADLAVERDLLVFTDEMYEKILYGESEHISIATLPGMYERTLTFNGLSKAYAMTGWRLGYVAAAAPFIQQIAKVHSHSATCATSFAQAGGVAALTGPQEFIGEMVQAWDRRRQLITEGFSAINGLHVPTIEGAFYGWVDARKTGESTLDLCERLLVDAHVAVVPGEAFGDSCGGFFRLSFATSDDQLATAIERVGNVLGRRT